MIAECVEADEECDSLELAIVPAGKGGFRATINGMALTKPTPQPLFDGCGALLALGYDPEAIVKVRHKDVIAMSGEMASWRSGPLNLQQIAHPEGGVARAIAGGEALGH